MSLLTKWPSWNFIGTGEFYCNLVIHSNFGKNWTTVTLLHTNTDMCIWQRKLGGESSARQASTQPRGESNVMTSSQKGALATTWGIPRDDITNRRSRNHVGNPTWCHHKQAPSQPRAGIQRDDAIHIARREVMQPRGEYSTLTSLVPFTTNTSWWTCKRCSSTHTLPNFYISHLINGTSSFNDAVFAG
jgi:hypothetical protein